MLGANRAYNAPRGRYDPRLELARRERARPRIEDLQYVGAGAAAVFIALIEVGGQSVSRQLGIPTFLSDVVEATLLLAMLAMLLLMRYRLRRIQPAAAA